VSLPGVFFVVKEPLAILVAGEESESIPNAYTFGIIELVASLFEGSSELRIRATSGASFSSRLVLDDLS